MKILSKSINRLAFVSILLVTLLSGTVYSQTNSSVNQSTNRKNAVFIEGLGHGFIYSFNYERYIFGNSKTHTSGQIGVSFYGEKSGIIPLWVPVSLNQSINLGKSSFIEAGVGKLLTNDGTDLRTEAAKNDYRMDDWIFRLGFKQYFKDGKWLFKIAYTPIYQDKNFYIHWGAVGLGYRF